MKLVPSPRFRKSLRRLDPQIQRRVRAKLKLFLENRYHPSLRYKMVQALKHEDPPVKEISITMSIRVTLQGLKTMCTCATWADTISCFEIASLGGDL